MAGRGGLLYKHISGANTYTIYTKGNYLEEIYVNTAATGSITVYESATASGPIIAVIDTSTTQNKGYSVVASAVTVVVVGAADITITYDGTS